MEDFSLKDKSHSGRPSAVEDDLIKTLIESDRHVTEREIGEKINIPQSILHDHMITGYLKFINQERSFIYFLFFIKLKVGIIINSALGCIHCT